MSTIGFGTLSSRSRSRIPNPPQNRTTFISGPPLDGRPYPKAVKQEVCARRRARHPFSRCGDATLRRRDARPSHAFLRQRDRSEEHTSELQSRPHLVCRLLLEKKKKKKIVIEI